MLNRIDDAVANYSAALKIYPKKVECYYNLGNAYCNNGQLQEAIRYYTKTISLDSLHDPALYNLGYAFHLSGDLEQAIHSYGLAAELNPSAECHFNLASAYHDNKDAGNAIKHYGECLKFDGENVQALVNIGELHYERGSWDDSQAAFKKALVLQSHNLQAKEGMNKATKAIEALAAER